VGEEPDIFPRLGVCVNRLKAFGCRLPIQLWYLGAGELDAKMMRAMDSLGVECVDALKVRSFHPVRRLGGWELKPFSILYSPFQEVLLLDADNVPVADPEYLFGAPEFRTVGAVFWPDYPVKTNIRVKAVWRSSGLRLPKEAEFESGQILVDKSRCWRALRLSLWFNEHSDFYYRYIQGDKDTFHLAFRKLRQPYHLVRSPIHRLSATMCQHDFQGRRMFQHRNMDKWNLELKNRRIKGFLFEKECRQDIVRLRKLLKGPEI
jgi:hypothetical protein